MTIDHESLQKLFYIDPEDVENYIGFYSRAMTSPDNLLAVKAKEGKLQGCGFWYAAASGRHETQFLKNIYRINTKKPAPDEL